MLIAFRGVEVRPCIAPMMALFHELDPDKPMTLDLWLELNDATDVFDAELLEILPPQFEQEYIKRCKMHRQLEEKFQKQQGSEQETMKIHKVEGPDIWSTVEWQLDGMTPEDFAQPIIELPRARLSIPQEDEEGEGGGTKSRANHQGRP